MYVCHLLLEDKPDKIIGLGNDYGAIRKQTDCIEPVARQGKIDRYRNPYQCSTYHRNNSGEASEEAQKPYIGGVEDEVTYHRDPSLDNCQQRDAYGIGTHNHKYLICYFLRIFVIEGKDVINVSFHFSSTHEHEIKDEYHDEQVDSEAADTAHDNLPDTWC